MAPTLPSCGDREHSVSLAVPPADRNAPNEKVMWKQLKSLNDIVFFIKLLEYSGNAIGTVAFLWATVVMLGGFCSLLSHLDFWFSTVMVFMEGTRIFISKDTSVNQWLFGSTRAFRWDHFCFSDMHDFGNLFAVIIGAGISLAPIEFGSQIITGILKVAILAITSLLLTRRHWNCFAKAIITLFLLAGVCGSFYGFLKLLPHKSGSLAYIKFLAIMTGTLVGAVLARKIMQWKVGLPGNPKRAFWIKVIVALGLVCLPVLQAKLGSNNKFKSLSIWIGPPLITVHLREAIREQEQSSNTLLLGTWQLLLKIVDTIMPILFFWGVLFPLPGISLKVSFYMLLSVIAAVLVGNLQIPVAFMQILLSSLRLHRLQAGHDYHPLPDGASPNLVPSIVVFFVLELCQGSSDILGVILGLFSFDCRRSLVRVLGLANKEWGAKAVNLYYHQACMTIKEKGLFPMEKSTPPSLDSFAIESLSCTSSEMQIVRLRVLDYYLQQGDSKSKRKLIAQIAKDAAGIVTKITGTISHLITDEEILSIGNDTDTNTNTVTHIVVQQKQNKEMKKKQICSSLSLSLNFVWRLAVTGGKIGTGFRQELSGNPILLHSLQRILDMEDCPQDLWEPAMDLIKWLALHDEATPKETGSTHAVIPKLMGVFLSRDDGHSLQKAAGEELAYLTITSSDNCGTILDIKAGPGRHGLIKHLISMLEDDNYMSVAANLLHNLCANSKDLLMELDAKKDLESDLQNVLQIIIGNKNDKQLNAALCVASQIGYVFPKDYAHVLSEKLAPNTDAAAKLVGKLVDALKSNIEPNPVYPRLRRFLIWTVISIVESCSEYKEIFRKKGAEDALNNLKGTSSRLEKFKFFVEGEGTVLESKRMDKLVREAKTKLRPETNPTPDAPPRDLLVCSYLST